jgi:hypothetical protein
MARSLYKSFLLWTRTLHIYATMLAMVLLIFFAFTGFVMNHAGVFGTEAFTATDSALKEPMPAKYLGTAAATATRGEDEPDMWAPRPGSAPAHPAADAEHELQVEVYLRLHGAHGERTDFEEQEDSIRMQFTGVGSKMEYTIGKPAGAINLHQEVRNTLALMSDLHKGTGAGGTWRLLIDGTAIFLVFASLSGLILWIALPKRRVLGIIALVLSVVLCGGCYIWLVP